jgi:hypothetical protein
MNTDGWLVAAPHRYAGERLARQSRDQVPGAYKVINHGKAISPAVNRSTLITLQPEGIVTGTTTGTWEFTRDNDITLVLDGIRYRGVFSTQWNEDIGAWVYAFSALSPDGVSLWGSKTVVPKHAPRTVLLNEFEALYGRTFNTNMPTPLGNPLTAYSYTLVSGPTGLTVNRATGVLSWRPLLSEVGIPYQVTVRALRTTAGDPDAVLYTFTITATSATVVRRLDLDFSSTASAGLRDVNGQFTGLTTRLPGTGAELPDADPNLRLDTAAGVLALSTTRADFFGRAGLPANSSPGVTLQNLGFTGSEDFAVTATFRPLSGLQFIDQVGLYVGASSDALTRAGTIVFGAPERYSAHSQDGTDHSGRFFGFGFNGSDGMTVTITRESGAWRYFVDGVEWNPLSPTTFLDSRADLVAGVFAITPLNSNPKTIQVDALSVVMATSEPHP